MAKSRKKPAAKAKAAGRAPGLYYDVIDRKTRQVVETIGPFDHDSQFCRYWVSQCNAQDYCWRAAEGGKTA